VLLANSTRLLRHQKEKVFPEFVDLYLMFNSNPTKYMVRHSYLFDLLELLKVTICWVNNNKIQTIKKFEKNLNWL
jgi:hypothetical protein